jgi:hypothetical protein
MFFLIAALIAALIIFAYTRCVRSTGSGRRPAR